jgi:two-component system, NarL family, invasion response regulator UvrY
MVRVLIADDHAVVRQGVKQILADQADMTVVGEAAQAHEVLTLVRRQDCDALLLDLSMPGSTGLETLKQLRHERPRLPVLVLTMHPEDQYAVRALKAGAAGYLTKDTAPDDLVTALRRVVRGGRYISQSLAEKLAVDVTTKTDGPLHELLSDREYQVLCLIAGGKAVSAIAGELALSVKTVSTYRARILEKMGLQNNSELTHYAIQNGLVT